MSHWEIKEEHELWVIERIMSDLDRCMVLIQNVDVSISLLNNFTDDEVKLVEVHRDLDKLFNLILEYKDKQ
jgi:acyl-ACP thioesterase